MAQNISKIYIKEFILKKAIAPDHFADDSSTVCQSPFSLKSDPTSKPAISPNLKKEWKMQTAID